MKLPYVISQLLTRREKSICANNTTDKDPNLRIESFAIIDLRGVSTKLNCYSIDHIHYSIQYISLIYEENNSHNSKIILKDAKREHAWIASGSIP